MHIKQKVARIYKSPFFYVLVLIVASLSIFLVVQQALRRGANNPQLSMVDRASLLAANDSLPIEALLKESIDISSSGTPFLIVYDEKGTVIASSAVLKGRIPALPTGVFSTIKNENKKSFTWQPEGDVRIAAVMKYFSGKSNGFILAGRSLRTVEEAEDYFLKIIIVGIITGVLIEIIIILWKRFVSKK